MGEGQDGGVRQWQTNSMSCGTPSRALNGRVFLKVDFIVRKDEPYRVHEFARRQRVSLPGFDVWIVSRDDLILSKLAWAKDSGSELQIRDVRSLLAGGADWTYLERWAPELSVTDTLRQIRDAGHDS